MVKGRCDGCAYLHEVWGQSVIDARRQLGLDLMWQPDKEIAEDHLQGHPSLPVQDYWDFLRDRGAAVRVNPWRASVGRF